MPQSSASAMENARMGALMRMTDSGEKNPEKVTREASPASKTQLLKPPGLVAIGGSHPALPPGISLYLDF